MIRVSDVVNALLRGVSVARVKSDLTSSTLSQEYLNNPDLRDFPVPRAEVRSAEIDMKYAIAETVDKAIDEEAIALDTIEGELPAYVDAVLSLPVKPTEGSPDSEYAPMKEHLGENLELVRTSLLEWLIAYFEANIAVLYPELIDFPRRLGRQYLQPETLLALTDILQANEITLWIADADFERGVRDHAQDWAEVAQAAVLLAVDIARSEFFDLDLAIKKDQLVGVEAHSMSSCKIIIYIQNYEWVESRDSDGNIINKLTLK